MSISTHIKEFLSNHFARQYRKTSVNSNRWGGRLGLLLQRSHPFHHGRHRVKWPTHVSDMQKAAVYKLA